jgi:hypothetical protein
LSIFRKLFDKIQVLLDSDKNNGLLIWIFMYDYENISLKFFLEWEMFRTKGVEKIKTFVLFNNFFFRKFCPLWDIVGKYCRTGQATDENMVLANCVLDT